MLVLGSKGVLKYQQSLKNKPSRKSYLFVILLRLSQKGEAFWLLNCSNLFQVQQETQFQKIVLTLEMIIDIEEVAQMMQKIRSQYRNKGFVVWVCQGGII